MTHENTGVYVLIACRECGKEVSSDAKVCPHCGYPKIQEDISIEKKKDEKHPIGAWIFVLGVLASVGMCMRSNAKDYEQQQVKCKHKGELYYREIGSFPKLSTGEDALIVIARKCKNSPIAFDYPN